MSSDTRIRINTGLLVFGLGGFVTGLVAFTTLRADVANLTKEVAKQNMVVEVVNQHTVEIATLKVEVKQLKR